MFKLQFLCSNENSAKKFAQVLQLESQALYDALHFKFEKLKHLTIYYLLTAEDKRQWQESVAKLPIEKKNALFRFVLAVTVEEVIKKNQEVESALLITSIKDKHQIDLVNFLIRQKLTYFENLVHPALGRSQKFLEQTVAKLDWKKQVVLTGNELTVFLEQQEQISHVLELKESLAIYKLMEACQQEDEATLLLEIGDSFYFLPIKNASESQLQKIILFLLFSHGHQIQGKEKLFLEVVKRAYEIIFQAAPFPIAIESSGKDIVWQNQIFSNLDLLPRMVKQMSANEKFQTKHGFFFVYKTPFKLVEGDYQLIYLAQQSEKIPSSNEELGIMTSSLAHEMNNPLSAIKAALEVVAMLSPPSENQQIMEQMQTSVHRCLQLVKIFLGFTKASHRLGASSRVEEQIPLRDCWDYALQLMRTRLISASLRLNQEWCVHKSFAVGNSNILTMMLYWILSQVVNIYERKLLVSSQNVSHDQRLQINEYDTYLSIKMDLPIKEIKDVLDQSLLMKHLLDVEGVQFKLLGQNEIVISH